MKFKWTTREATVDESEPGETKKKDVAPRNVCRNVSNANNGEATNAVAPDPRRAIYE